MKKYFSVLIIFLTTFLVYANDPNNIFGVWNAPEKTPPSYFVMQTAQGNVLGNINSMRIERTEDKKLKILFEGVIYYINSIKIDNDLVIMQLQYKGALFITPDTFVHHTFTGIVIAHFIDPDSIWLEVDVKNSEDGFSTAHFPGPAFVYWRAHKVDETKQDSMSKSSD